MLAYSRRKTGQPEWFREMKREQIAKRHLSKIPTREAAKESPENSLVLLKLAPEYPTIWDIFQAKYDDLLAVKGVGEVGLQRLHGFLQSRSVNPLWDAPNRTRSPRPGSA